MVVIGITGGIAAGKSFVTRELGRRGAALLHADRIGHAVLRLPQVKRALLQRWGETVFEPGADGQGLASRGVATADSAGGTVAAERQSEGELGGRESWVRCRSVDRQAVARRVFAPPPDGPEELAFLERLTHPLIGAIMTRRLDRWRHSGHFPAAVLDAPVLYKAGWDAHCDTILFVDAPWAVRVRRAACRGWSPGELARRQAMQPDLEGQRERADVVIDNSGSRERTTEQIKRFWQTLIREIGQ